MGDCLRCVDNQPIKGLMFFLAKASACFKPPAEMKAPLVRSVLLMWVGISGISSAALIAPTTTYAHNIQGGGGISSLFDDNDNGGTSKITKPDANDPSTWTATGQAWPDDWQGNGPLNVGTNAAGTNGKFGWVAFDFGSVSELDEIFIWNVSEATGQPRRVLTYNIYYSDTPTVALASGNGNAAASVDYNFASGGWTQLGATRSLLQWADGTGADGIETLDVSARYIGLEFITYGGDANRIGLNEVVFTAVPEPSAALLVSFGVLGLLRRRK